MIDRLATNRPFLLLLAVLALLALMPWQIAQGAGEPCCCSTQDGAAAQNAADVTVQKAGSCCCEIGGQPPRPDPDPQEGPDQDDPCPCWDIGLPWALPPATSLQHEAQDGTDVLVIAAVDRVPARSADQAELLPPKPRARSGPGLHLRLSVLLI